MSRDMILFCMLGSSILFIIIFILMNIKLADAEQNASLEHTRRATLNKELESLKNEINDFKTELKKRSANVLHPDSNNTKTKPYSTNATTLVVKKPLSKELKQAPEDAKSTSRDTSGPFTSVSSQASQMPSGVIPKNNHLNELSYKWISNDTILNTQSRFTTTIKLSFKVSNDPSLNYGHYNGLLSPEFEFTEVNRAARTARRVVFEFKRGSIVKDQDISCDFDEPRDNYYGYQQYPRSIHFSGQINNKRVIGELSWIDKFLNPGTKKIIIPVHITTE